jgi:site-specific recombinase XerD
MTEQQLIVALNRFDHLAQPARSGPADDHIRAATIEFFAVRTPNPHTRSAYWMALQSFLSSLELQGVSSVLNTLPIHVAFWVRSQEHYAPTTIKQRLAGLNMYFSWLVKSGLMLINPAGSIKGPRYSQGKGKTAVISSDEARLLIQAMDVTSVIGLRDRALIGVMLYSFARIGAALRLTYNDVFVQNRRFWLRLQEKGGKLHDLPCHHELEQWLDEYVKVSAAGDPEWKLFRAFDRRTQALSEKPLAHANAYEMVRRRAAKAGIKTKVCNHTFRATGITSYLSNGGTLEIAARLANHSSTRTTQLYDRRSDAITLTEVERIRF